MTNMQPKIPIPAHVGRNTIWEKQWEAAALLSNSGIPAIIQDGGQIAIPLTTGALKINISPDNEIRYYFEPSSLAGNAAHLPYIPADSSPADIADHLRQAIAHHGLKLLYEGSAITPRDPEVIQVIQAAAGEAFWAKVALLVPQARTGDLDPSTVIMLEQAQTQAIEAWVAANLPNEISSDQPDPLPTHTPAASARPQGRP